MKKSKFIISSIFIVILTLVLAQTVLSNIFSTSGVAMSKLYKEIQAYKIENAKISEKLFAESSLSNIESKAKKLGFSDGKSQFVLSTSLSLASKQ